MEGKKTDLTICGLKHDISNIDLESSFPSTGRCFNGLKVIEYPLDASHFQIENKLASGLFGTVYKALYNRTNFWVAIKKSFLNGECTDRLQKEADVITEISKKEHKNIIKYFGSFKCSGNLQLVYELGDMSLYHLFYKNTSIKKTLGLAHFNNVAAQLLEIVVFLKNSNITHDDITMSNLIYFSSIDRIKLTDFSECHEKSNRCLDPDVIDSSAILFEVQLLIKHNPSEEQSFCKARKVFFGRRGVSESLDKEFLNNKSLWLKDMPETSKEIIMFYHKKQCGFPDKIISLRKYLEPTESLMEYFSEHSTQPSPRARVLCVRSY